MASHREHHSGDRDGDRGAQAYPEEAGGGLDESPPDRPPVEDATLSPTIPPHEAFSGEKEPPPGGQARVASTDDDVRPDDKDPPAE